MKKTWKKLMIEKEISIIKLSNTTKVMATFIIMTMTTIITTFPIQIATAAVTI
jgi:hypothetical protein